METNSYFYTDQYGYNYIDALNQTKNIAQLIKKSRREQRRIAKLIKKRQFLEQKIHTIHSECVSKEDNCNQITRQKMDDIMKKIKNKNSC